MKIKNLLRRLGYDIIHYHSFYDTMVRPRGIRMLLDIGSNTGQYATMMRKKFPDLMIHSFEPLPDCFEQLQHTMQGDKHFKAWNVALGQESGVVTMYRSSFNPSSSLLPMGALHKTLYPKSAQGTPEQVAIRRLDDMTSELSLEEPYMVKIDVQGFEDKVIRGGTHVIQGAVLVLIESSFVSLYEGQPLFGDINALMKSLGFAYRGRSETHYNTKTGEPIYEDSLYIRINA